MRLPIALAACLISALPASAEPPGVTRAAVFAAEDELAGGPVAAAPAVWMEATDANASHPPAAAQSELLFDPPANTMSAAPAPPRRVLNWAGRTPPATKAGLRGRRD